MTIDFSQVADGLDCEVHKSLKLFPPSDKLNVLEAFLFTVVPLILQVPASVVVHDRSIDDDWVVYCPEVGAKVLTVQLMGTTPPPDEAKAVPPAVQVFPFRVVQVRSNWVVAFKGPYSLLVVTNCSFVFPVPFWVISHLTRGSLDESAAAALQEMLTFCPLVIDVGSILQLFTRQLKAHLGSSPEAGV